MSPNSDAKSVASTDDKSVCSTHASTEVMVASTGEKAEGETLDAHTSYLCCTCSASKTKDDLVLVRAASKASPNVVYRCKICHSARSRLNRILSRRGQMAEDWEKMSEQERSNFIKNNNNLYGKELETRVTDAIMLSTIKSSTTSFTGTGDFKTEEDLRKDWAHAPHIADNIIKNSRSFKDDVKGVTLYEDMKYQSQQVDSTSNTQTRRMKMESGPHEAKVEKEKDPKNPGDKVEEEGKSSKRRKTAEAKKQEKEQVKQDSNQLYIYAHICKQIKKQSLNLTQVLFFSEGLLQRLSKKGPLIFKFKAF